VRQRSQERHIEKLENMKTWTFYQALMPKAKTLL
jgi:hypothetical protein